MCEHLTHSNVPRIVRKHALSNTAMDINNVTQPYLGGVCTLTCSGVGGSTLCSNCNSLGVDLEGI